MAKKKRKPEPLRVSKETQEAIDRLQAAFLSEEADRVEQEGDKEYAQKLRKWAAKLRSRIQEKPG